MSKSAQSETGGRFNLARLSIERPVLTWLVILFCLFGGIQGFTSVGRLEDPAFTIKEAIVVTPYPGATAEEVEDEVTERLETAIQQMSQLDEVFSESSPGVSEIHVRMRDEFDGTELPQVWDELRKRIRDAASSLPPGVGESVVLDDFGDVYGILYAVVAPGYTDREIRDIADDLRRELLVVDGVSKVQVSGVPEERIYIEISQEDLARLGLPVEAVLSTLSNENAVVSAGEAPSGDRLLRIEMPQSIGGVQSIENLLISPRDSGQTLRLSDIANVTRAPVERADVYIYHNGEPAFTLGVSGLADANIVDVGEAVEARLAELEQDLPVGVELKPIYEQHTVVAEATNGFLVNLALSVGIVIGVLCLFMGWRAGVTVGVVLLLTVLGTLFFMNAFDITMQRISLGALIIAMGMLVDNAIVVTEGIQVSVQRGEDRMKAAEDAVSSTKWPLLGATIIGIMAFSGIGLSPDSTGEFLFSLFAVIGISLMLSWILAITVAPMIAYHLFKGEKADPDADPHDRGMYGVYRNMLVLALRHRIATVAALVVIFIGSIYGFGFVRQAFFPNSNTPMFYVNMTMPQGADILDTDEVIRDVARFAGEQEHARSVDAFVGRGATRFMLTYASEQPNPAYGQLIVQTRTLDEIPPLADAILAYVSDTYPQLEARSERIVFGPPSGAQLEARFMGPDAEVLRTLAEEAMRRLNEAGEFRDLRTDWRNRELVLVPQILPERARTIGVTRGDVAEALSYATSGSRVGVFREGDLLIPIIARAPEAERATPDSLTDRLIWSPSQNAYVPISQVVSGFELEAHESLIQRRNRVRTLTVQGNPGSDETTAASAFPRFAEIVSQIDLPHGYTLEWGGEHEASSEANESLGGVLPLSFLVMLVTSFLLFQSVRQPLIIWLIVPMSICGVSMGLLATGVAFSFTALLGLLSLSGMLIKNAIVLVDEVDQRINKGQARFDAMVKGSVSRLRPVLLAAGTTILGMTPLIFDAFFQGMAVTIICGLAFATVLTMIATPVFYALFFRIKPDEVEGKAAA
ncbi:transporter, AcrB/AcrD/AcrF family protein [Oceanicaulis alexandrii HTCC2633]|uniref:efflux RND transporter permease subunit n=1 Tax=Oceanicaulis sp. HTCC2633 TaxID=314254 RepID=UPI0000668A69|nr:efflux RND transporter permease subunit [Oceanicaulis sp. HTCC2633]EAP90406.1 transporter, AcrB/AcrD/AcrF family protein [Oceanicaulis alexandrii HTCC2633] [Oceanicaulis sp. HTCC2633]